MDNVFEHSVERKKEGLYRFKKAAIISAWIFGPFIIIGLCMAVVYLRFMLLMLPLFAWLAVKIGPITAAYGEEVYEYSIVMGEMSFARVYGDRFRKQWFRFTLKDCLRIEPYDGVHASHAEDGDFAHIYKAVSSMNAPHVYFAIYNNALNERCIAFFEVSQKTLKAIKMYYPQTVMTIIDN